MKIGIVTQMLSSNYGGILQNYALQKVLREMGHEVYTIDIGKYTWLDWSLDVVKFFIKKLIYGESIFPKSPLSRASIELPLRRFVYHHIETTIPRTKRPNKRHLIDYAFDVLIVGSDQVWRPIYNTHIEDMFLAFSKGMSVKRIAYAASFGTDKWEFSDSQTVLCSKLAKCFSAISVREDSGVILSREHLGVSATQVLDPTLLLNSMDYLSLCENIEKQKPFVFAYILDNSTQIESMIKNLARSKDLPYKIVRADSGISNHDSIELWLSYFRDSQIVITDSFHGTVFSIIFKKQFIMLGNENRGNSRFDSINKLLLLDQNIKNGITDNSWYFNWDKIYQRLSDEQEKSRKWILNSLQ